MGLRKKLKRMFDLENMMLEADTLNKQKSVIACVDDIDEAQHLAKIANNEELDSYIMALELNIK